MWEVSVREERREISKKLWSVERIRTILLLFNGWLIKYSQKHILSCHSGKRLVHRILIIKMKLPYSQKSDLVRKFYGQPRRRNPSSVGLVLWISPAEIQHHLMGSRAFQEMVPNSRWVVGLELPRSGNVKNENNFNWIIWTGFTNTNHFFISQLISKKWYPFYILI